MSRITTVTHILNPTQIIRPKSSTIKALPIFFTRIQAQTDYPEFPKIEYCTHSLQNFNLSTMASDSSSSTSSTDAYQKEVRHIHTQIKQVKAGSILDKNGFITHSANPTMADKVLKKFEKAGLLKYMTHD